MQTSISFSPVLRCCNFSISFGVKEKLGSIQPHFNTYLHHGYYPFYKAVRNGYEIRLQHVVNQVLERDYPMIDDVTVSTIEKTKKMLIVLAQSVPQMPTMNTLYGQLETGRNQGLKMLYALQRADLLQLLTDNTKNLKSLGRPEKIFLHNTNLMYALGAPTFFRFVIPPKVISWWMVSTCLK